MGTRGAFGVIIGEKEKIGYNQYDSYPDGKGIENLRWLRESLEDTKIDLRKLAADARVVSNDKRKPTKKQIEHLASVTDLGVSEQSTSDWYCLTRHTHGNIGAMLACGYIEDNHDFPLDSLFCEWAYIVDFDREVFQVYEGFQEKLPKRGRWAKRPSKDDNERRFKEHLYWCYQHKREPFLDEVPKYKAVELVGEWPFDALPSDEEFLAWANELSERREREYAEAHS